jgi:hypothetical protein
VTATPDDLWKKVNHVPVSSLASYAGSVVVLAAAFSQPSVYNSAIAVGSAAAMAFFAAETHRADPMSGHKHSIGQLVFYLLLLLQLLIFVACFYCFFSC